MTTPNHLLAHGRIALVERFAQHASEGLTFGGEAKY
jgi:hypothetical protein